MTGLPSPRDSETVTVLSMVVADLRALRETTVTGFRDLTAAVDKLRAESVHRREFERYRDEHKVDALGARRELERQITAARTDAAEDLAALKDELAAVSGLKKWVVGTLVAGAGAAGALGGFVTSIIHH